MNYQAALEFILSRSDYERWPGYNYASRFDLRRMEELLARLGDPHRSSRSVHIAGSKGKGSTAAMIAAGLIAAGYSTGLYTSPHLHSFRERINVGGKPITQRELARVISQIKPPTEAVEQQCDYGEITTFEVLTAAAFLYFQQMRVDFQVLETGLGGRLDATNVVTPEVCVITSISLDHQEVLGDTIAEIAIEKAGIIKAGNLVVSSPQVPEVAGVIKETCLKKDASLIQLGSDITWQKISSDLSGQTLEVKGRRGCYRFTIPLLGNYQMDNAATAVLTLEVLGLPKEIIENGLGKTRWPGRLQVLSHRPMMVVDGAHNSDSAKKLREALLEHFQFNRITFIIGLSGDKDISGIITELVPLADSVIATRSCHPRAIPPEVIVAEFNRHGVKAEVADDVAQAVAIARATAGRRDLICGTGSLFLVAEVIEYVKGLRAERYPQYSI